MKYRFLRHRFWAEESCDIRYLLSIDLKGKTVLDVGANIGIFSYWMSRTVGNTGHVYAFEAQPELETWLLDLKRTFKLTNLNIVNKALSDKAGKQTLYRSFVGAGGATFHYINNNELEIQVEKITLDDYIKLNGITDVAFIKCDVEGHELSVFEGARATLEKFLPYLLFECHDECARSGELFSFLKTIGFDGFFIIDDKLVHYSLYDKYPYSKPTRHHRNYVFGPAEKVSNISGIISSSE